MEAQKTEIVFLKENNIDLLKHLQELKIENFRILGNLITSYYGQILWSEFILNKTFNLMQVING